MKKQAIVIDSTVYLTKEEAAKYDFEVVSLNVVDKTESFRELDVDNKFVFDKQDEGSQLTTSQPAPGEFLEIYEKLIAKGFEKIYFVGLSSAISGTFQSANLAKNMLDDPEKVYVFDTLLAAYGSAMVALKLFELVEEGNTDEEIEKQITNVINSSNQLFTVENLFHLAKGGRLSKTSATIGTVLRVKPIIRVIKGKLELVHKERTYAKLHRYLVNAVKEEVKDSDKITFRITDSNSFDNATSLKVAINEAFPNAKVSVSHYLGPVFSIHIGPKGYGLSWFVE